jgi:uncharacterized protein YwqG/predicted DNA-binding protein (MmcQ/YjbR family)
MNKQTASLIDRLRLHCRTKPGAGENEFVGDEDEPGYNVLRGFLNNFAEFYLNEAPPVLLLRCRDSVRKRLSRIHGGVRISERMHWKPEGWRWTDVTLDGSVPEETLRSLIDHSYQLVIDSFDHDQRHEIDLVAHKLPPAEVLADLIAWHGLGRRRSEIERLARPALLLKTKRTPEGKLAVGRSKIGGRPDLPDGLGWPAHRGKPLAFLAQLNLAELPGAASVEELPRTGMLWFFSVFGWQVEGDADPQLPRGRPTRSWTQVLWQADNAARLRRVPTPPTVNSFQASGVEFVPITCLPASAEEPAVTRRGWKESEKEKYEDLQSTFEAVCDDALGNPPRHLLLGFADYEQEFVEAVAEEGLRLLFQLASDDNPAMGWGDGGYLYFFLRPQDLKRRNFTRVTKDYQCG